ncbi:MAG: Methylase involved in ubiquinone/menaquinone biosynthesis [Candidatus Woesebacteria bacterium GW2011_GWA1_39_21]|uniref:Methylase involved in ubiquinone/menaquinone biosynthesis n=1 Tax=Candidatus Woesebacteria bacterium GW2011_GWA1_39_21 TaxID=1618550 RepID=A0A0G0QN70_9BACT|nr:MAG: Methylase involved in ubiquinone/menaquinone biosynthesis [Candidatus Woesebacteria bacterium GW2011_GWA1_39_21]
MSQKSIRAKSFTKSKDHICQHTYSKTIHSYGRYQLNRCLECGIIFSAKFKSVDPNSVYVNYYQNETPIRFRFGIEFIVKAFRLFRAFKLFTIDPHAKKILDIGSGRGYTLLFLRKYFNYDKTVGTQIEKHAYNFSKNVLKLEIYDKDLLDLNLPKNSFDFVTILHVLEHVKYPEEYIVKIKSLLKKDGHVVIEVPNFDSWTRRFCQEYWLGLDLKYHLYFFNKMSLCGLLQSHGFKIQKVHTFSLEYSTFTSVQSIVSWITKTDSVFFNLIQGNTSRKNTLPHILLFALLTLPVFLINLLLYFSDSGEDLLVVATNDK